MKEIDVFTYTRRNTKMKPPPGVYGTPYGVTLWCSDPRGSGTPSCFFVAHQQSRIPAKWKRSPLTQQFHAVQPCDCESRVVSPPPRPWSRQQVFGAGNQGVSAYSCSKIFLKCPYLYTLKKENANPNDTPVTTEIVIALRRMDTISLFFPSSGE